MYKLKIKIENYIKKERERERKKERVIYQDRESSERRI